MKRLLFFIFFLFLSTYCLVPAFADDNAIGYAGSLLDALSEPPASVAETTLGDVTADAVKELSGSDIALIPAGFFAANIQPGEVYWEDIQTALPSEELFVTVNITPAQLHKIMEQALSHIELTEHYAIDINASVSEDFLQVSGFSVQYDPNMLPGERIHTLSISGTEYNPEDAAPLLSVTLPRSLANTIESKGAFQKEDFTAAEALRAYFQARDTLDVPDLGRLYAMAVRDNDYINRFPIVLLCFSAIAVAVCGKLLIKMKSENEANYRRYR